MWGSGRPLAKERGLDPERLMAELRELTWFHFRLKWPFVAVVAGNDREAAR